jgi:ubiquinone/menaquinone biosynthesis C-methylase UbiE
MNYDDTNIPEAYMRGRHHGPAFLEQWMNVVASHVQEIEIRDILDLGCGTGRFSRALAAQFNAALIGIDPSAKMLVQAQHALAGDIRVVYVRGSAEAIPLQADSMDLIFISMVFHHFEDPPAVAQECRRVLRPNGRVCLRTASSEQIPNYPYVPFFPASRVLLEQRIPSLISQCRPFEAASFQTLYTGQVVQQIAPDYRSYAEKLAAGADSILASLDHAVFQAGLAALRAQPSDQANHPVVEPVDFAVFKKDEQ